MQCSELSGNWLRILLAVYCQRRKRTANLFRSQRGKGELPRVESSALASTGFTFRTPIAGVFVFF